MVRKRGEVFGNAIAAAEAISKQDQAAAAAAEERRGQRSTLPLAKIRPRTTDTRPLNEKHVESLAESITALGLIEPLVVDVTGCLLAGGHRLAALHQIQTEQPEKFAAHFAGGLIPVRMMSFDAAQDQEQALAIELAENEKRVNYTRDQIERLAERLRALNYKDTRGRPKAGEKGLAPALAVAIGVSTRYVRQVLSDQKLGRARDSDLNRNSVPIFLKRQKLLQKLEATLAELATLPGDNSHKKIDRLSRELRAEIQAALAKKQGK